jgi:hypothetical protein
MGAPTDIAFTPCSGLESLQSLFPVDSNKLHKPRDKFAYSLNETPSLVDSVYKDSRDPLVNDVDNDSIDPKDKEAPAGKLALSLDASSLASKVLTDYRQTISLHVERRILFFFTQLIACYKTTLHFEIGDTLDQGDSPTRVNIPCKAGSLTFQRNAAHSNTLPCLLASDRKQWLAFKQGTIKNRTDFIFLKGTDFYRLWNSTINMPRWVNNADIIIDGTNSIEKLRKSSLKLINLASRGKTSPHEAIDVFIIDCLARIEHGIASKKTDVSERQVLFYYKEDLERIQKCFLQQRDSNLQNLLTVVIDPSASADYRTVIYQIRYRAIRDSQLAESELVKKIDAVRKQILKDYFPNRKPVYFTPVFRTLLIEQVLKIQHRKLDQQRLKTLYNFSPETFQGHLSAGPKTCFEQTKKAFSDSEQIMQKITEVTSTVLEDMQKLRKKARTQIGLVIQELRSAKGWTEEDCKKELKKVFPEDPSVDDLSIRDVERGETPISSDLAKKLGQVFQVNSNFFTPHFFYS